MEPVGPACGLAGLFSGLFWLDSSVVEQRTENPCALVQSQLEPRFLIFIFGYLLWVFSLIGLLRLCSH